MLLDGQESEARALEFWGPRGSGKSWLLQHLAAERYQPPDGPPGKTGSELAFDERVRSLYVDLSAFAPSNVPAEQGVEALIRAIGQHVAGWLSRAATGVDTKSASLTERSDWLAIDVRELTQTGVFVLLLDHVSERSEAFLGVLESRVLGPLVRLPRVLLVMSKRGRGYPWREGVIRWNLRDRDLAFFDVEATGTQLGLDSKEAYEIWQQSRGCPLTNYFLSGQDGYRRAANALLAGVSSPDRQRIEALCVLRFIREDHFPLMLAAYHDELELCRQDEGETDAQLASLLDLGLIRWDREIDGFVLDPAIRPLLERWLLESNRERWRRLQCEAYALYIDWLARDPGSARRWIDEIHYHGEQLQREGFELYDCFPSCCYEERYRSQARAIPEGYGEPDRRIVAWSDGLTQLRDLLAQLYPTEGVARQLVEQAAIPSGRIQYSSAAVTNWHNILAAANLHDKVAALVSIASQEYPEWAGALSDAHREYLRQREVLPVEHIVQSAQPNLQAIRGLLREAFIRGELRRFCSERALFQPICDHFKPKMNRKRQINIVLKYCRSRLILSELLTEIRAFNPRQYERYAPYLYGTGGLPQDFATG
jgi:hypothetical protein